MEKHQGTILQAIPLHRTNILRPFTQFLSETGAPINRVLRQVKLPTLALDDSNNYISSLAFWKFVETMASKENIKNLGFRVGERYGANALDPNFDRLLSHSPTLYHALITTCRVAAAEISRSKIFVSSTDMFTTRFCHRTSFGIEHPIHQQMEWFAIMSMIGIIQEFTGPSWRPREIGLMSHRKPVRAVREYFSGSRFLNGQAYSFVSIEKSLMTLPPLAKSSTEAIESEAKLVSSMLGEPAVDFVGSLKQVLQSYLPGGTPHIALASEIAGTSVRSLQRELSKSRLTYLDLLERIRFETATRLLKETNAPIYEIADKLGYSDPSPFARAFRRTAGITPSEYRRFNT